MAFKNLLVHYKKPLYLNRTRIAGFSDCSLEALQKLDDFCLYDLPSKELKPKCGNGIVEGEEECDCGNEQNCKDKDPCCEATGCKLKKGSQCSDFNHLCCKQCLFKPHGALCRAPEGQCDVAERCTGTTGKCPNDDFRRNGEQCNSEKQIIPGVEYYGRTRKHIFHPPITASHIRINPSHWSDKKCLTTELYGCDDQSVEKSNVKTPLASGKFCIKPQRGGCRPRDGTNLVFTMVTDCDQKEMQFTLSANGVLRHACSNTLVCPENSNNFENTLLVLSRKCSTSQATYERTSAGSLKHRASGLCVHPYRGEKQEGSKWCIYSGCDEERLRVDFMRLDCLLPLGMANGKIKDHQITASSYIDENSRPQFARLVPNTKKAWCGLGGKDQYLQIDFDKTVTVKGMLIRGLEWNYVQGYYIYYSQDGQRWNAYTETPDSSGFNSYCYMGKCSETRTTQCADLWGPGAVSADKACYDKYNKEGKRYGTCNPSRNTRCRAEDVFCGQIQCLDKYNDKPVVDYGTNYQRQNLPGGKQCSVASLKMSDFIGLGMVREGTKCARDKICIDYKCQRITLKSCPRVKGKECAGNGVCSNEGKCVCNNGYDADSSCSKAVSAVDGQWGTWSSWSECSRVCNGGTRVRYRLCDNPSPRNGGKMCLNERMMDEKCNMEECPEAHSCRHLQKIGKATNRNYKDNIYKINPDGKGAVMTYCDMSRDGGGWTLLITSHTNKWTRRNVKMKNERKPSLKKDFSILFKADNIKDSANVKGDSFEYRLEANKFGHWGGIWKAPRSYSFLATDNSQTNVDLQKKFDDWEYESWGIEKRMPYLYGERLTLAGDPKDSIYGSITASMKEYHPAPWIWGKEKESQPAYIWYWMREGEYEQPMSCMDVLTRSYSKAKAQDGIYTLKLGDKQVKTYCDMSRNGGAWTLLLTKSSQRGWSGQNIKERNPDKPSLEDDFSILGNSDFITNKREFQYRIEADGNDMWGGIWEAEKGSSLASTSAQQNNIQLLQKFGNWDETVSNLNKRVPYIKQSSSYTTSHSGDLSGTLISGSRDAVYIKNSKPRPRLIRVWVREGTRRSCFQIKAIGERHNMKFNDGFYLVKLQESHIYQPVYCDMTSEPGAYTLLVTSAHGNWRVQDVQKRNFDHPSLTNDYSILGMADSIKDAAGSKKFRYKLEANQRGSWGGVWEAPVEYSFVNTNNLQTNVRLIKRFGQWNTNRDSIQNRMPYMGQSKALLTTNDQSDWYGPGSIITDNSDMKPAGWIYPEMYEPGVIWYWINEDDCDSSRKPVHGGVSGWSSWGPCDQVCKPGKQKRHKKCDKPKPRCGGDPCDVQQMSEETRDCNICAESPIRSSTGLCVQPRGSGCSIRDDTDLVYSNSPRDCSRTNQAFVLGEDGVLIHKCSGKFVCPNDDSSNNLIDAKLMLSSKCTKDQARFLRTRAKSLKHASSGLCVHPEGGLSQTGGTLVLWNTCDEQRIIHDFFKLD